jgi:CheY-like chemotaxis protein
MMRMVKTIVATHDPDLARDFDRDLLRRKDLRLLTVRTSDELVARLREGGHLAFVSRVLPDGDAESALAQVRADRALAQVPVVLVTTEGAPASDRQTAREAGFAEVVELPAPPGALPLLVARLLGMPLRENERFAVRIHVFDHAGGDPQAEPGPDAYLGTSVDLSEHGILLKAKRTLPIGTQLKLRFSLPGRAGELTPTAKVVRIDESSMAPAKGLALNFEDLGPFERNALRDYLKVLVSGRPFHWQVNVEDGRQVVSMFGVLGADADLEPLRSLKGQPTFRLREFRRISSDSVQRWIDFVRSLGGVNKIALIECPISFIHQANLITNLLDRQEVESFFAPYTCEACGLETEQLLSVAEHLEGGKRRAPPSFPCSACGAPLVFDDLVEQYFAFLDR